MFLNPYRFGVPAGSVFTITSRSMGAVNQETYAYQLTTSGGNGSVNWSIVSGSLPPGLHLNGGTGLISGVPNASNGEYTVTVRARDSIGQVVDRLMVIPVGTIVSLLHMEGANGATAIADATGKSWTRSGTPSLTTAAPKFGASAAQFGVAGDRWSTPNVAAFDFSQTPFTVRAWAQPTSVAAAGQSKGVMGARGAAGAGTTGDWLLYQQPSDGGWSFEMPTTAGGSWTSSVAVAAPGGAPTQNTYQFLVGGVDAARYMWAARDGKVARGLSPLTAAYHIGASPLVVGTLGDGSIAAANSFVGQLDEIAVIQGAYLYPEDFPVPTAPSDYPVAVAALAVSGSLPRGASGSAYASNTNIRIQGVNTPFTVSVVSGALPAGWAAATSGNYVQVTGAATADGYYNATLRVQDSLGNTADLPLTLQVGQAVSLYSPIALSSNLLGWKGWWDASDATTVVVDGSSQLTRWNSKNANGSYLQPTGGVIYNYRTAQSQLKNLNALYSTPGQTGALALTPATGKDIVLPGAKGWVVAVVCGLGTGTTHFDTTFVRDSSATPKRALTFSIANKQILNIGQTGGQGLSAGLALDHDEPIFVGLKWGENAGYFLGDVSGGDPGSLALTVTQMLEKLNGYICELLIGDDNISWMTFLELRDYLSKKWGCRGVFDTGLAALPALDAWYDGSDPSAVLSLDSTPSAGRLLDKSGNGRHLTVVSTNKPSSRRAQQNSRNTFYGLQTAAVKLAMTAGAIPMVGKGCAIAVFRPTSNGGNWGTVLASGPTNPGDFYLALSRADARVYNYDGSTLGVPAAQFNGTSVALLADKWGEGDAVYANGRFNGGAGAGTKNINGTLDYFDAAASGGTWWLDGDLCEMIFFAQDLTHAQFNLLRDYLRKKWGANVSNFEALLHFEGADGSKVVLEESGKATQTLTSAFAAISATQKKFGNSSLAILGTNGIVNPPTFTVAGSNGDWTLGAWFYWDGGNSSSNKALVSFGASWELYLKGSNANKLTLWLNPTIPLVSPATPTANAWHLAVLECVGNTTYMSIDGVVVASTPSAIAIPAGPMYVGTWTSGSESWSGYLDEMFLKLDGSMWGGQDFIPPIAPFDSIYATKPMWTPKQLAVEPGVWLSDDSRTGTLGTTAVDSWADLSSNARTAVQATAANQPVKVDAVKASRRIVRLDGVNDYLALPLALGNTVGSQLTMYVVEKTTVAAATAAALVSTRSNDNVNAADGFSLRHSGPGTVQYFHTNQTPVLSAAVPTGQFNIVSAWKNNLSARLGVNGVNGAYSVTTAFVPSANNGGVTHIGAEQAATSSFFPGDIAEFIALGYIPTAAEDAQIVGYLAWRWGLQGNLPVGHPYKELPPVRTGQRDPYFSNVRALLEPSGADGSTVFTDLSGDGRVVTRIAPAVVGTKAGSHSPKTLQPGAFGRVEVAGSGISIPSTADFTAEVRFWLDTANANYKYLLKWARTDGGIFSMRFGDSGFSNWLHCGQNDKTLATIWQLPVNQAGAAGAWHTLAYSRRSGVSRIFYDGVQQTVLRALTASPSSTSWADTDDYTPSGVIEIGGNVSQGSGGADASFSGSIDWARLTVGTGRWAQAYQIYDAPPTTA